MTSDGKRSNCIGLRADGSPCRAAARPGSPHCWAHAPELQQQREDARKQGGQNSAAVVRLQAALPPRLKGLYNKLETALDDLLADKPRITPSQATAAAAIARAMVTLLEAGELAEQLRSIEERLTEEAERKTRKRIG